MILFLRNLVSTRLCYTLFIKGRTAMGKTIQYEISVPADIAEVWGTWTTEAGAKSFFAPDCKIDLKPGGAYEMYFNLDAPLGEQGGEGNIILALQLEKMLSFTWNAPTYLPEVRDQRTHVTLFFTEIEPGQTQLNLTHDGWGEGDLWDQAFDYFIQAWGEVVLPRLKYRFEEGPIDWDNPPQLGKRSQ
jgi:uncharacterized protein YndB with AHSA1/START domain